MGRGVGARGLEHWWNSPHFKTLLLLFPPPHVFKLGCAADLKD